MKSLRGLLGIGLIILGLWAALTVAQGLLNGHIVQFAKHGNLILFRHLTPERFWIAIVFWSIGTVMLIGGGFKLAKENLIKENN